MTNVHEAQGLSAWEVIEKQFCTVMHYFLWFIDQLFMSPSAQTFRVVPVQKYIHLSFFSGVFKLLQVQFGNVKYTELRIQYKSDAHNVAISKTSSRYDSAFNCNTVDTPHHTNWTVSVLCSVKFLAKH